MKNIFQSLLLAIFTVFALASCEEKAYFAFDRVVFVDKFPVEYAVSDPEELEIDAVGILGIRSFDDYLLLSCADPRGCLCAFSKADGSLISSPFLKTGNGPGEVLYQPFMCWLSFTSQPDGGLRAGIYDYKGSYIEYDVNRSIESGCPSWQCLSDSLSMLSGARYFRVSDDYLICSRSRADRAGCERFLVDRAGHVSHNAAMDCLNSITSSDRNVVASLFIANADGRLVAELGGRLGVIQMYSLTDENCLTIAIGKRLENIREVEQREPEDMPKSYYDARSFKDYFAGLYLNTTIKDLDANRFSPEIHLFSWSGRPLARITLPVSTLYFDMDVTEGQLYIVENETERVLRYDVSAVLAEVERL